MRVVGHTGHEPVSGDKIDASWRVILTDSWIVNIDVEVEVCIWADGREALADFFTDEVISWAYEVALAFASLHVEIFVPGASWCDQFYLTHALARWPGGSQEVWSTLVVTRLA